MKKNVVFILIAFAVVTCFAQFGRRIGNPSRARPGLGPRGPAAAQQPDAANSAAEDAIKNAPRGTNGVPALVFDKAPMELVLKAYGDLVQKTIIPAPDLPKAEITLKSLEGQVLEKDEYLEAIEVVLGMNGVVLEPRGEKFLRALAKKTVRTKGIPILIKNKGNLPEQGRVVSQMITFQNILATEAQKALEGFKDPDGLFQVFERTNAILVTDTQENINRMLEIVREIDIASPVQEDVFTVQIKYALAADIKKALETIVTESQKEQPKETVTTKTSGTPGFTRSQPPIGAGRLLNINNRPGVQPPPEKKPNETLMAAVSDADRGMIRGKVLILDDERSNKLIIITSKANMKFFDKVIETLDVETTPDVQIKVFRLKYAECEDVASMLNDLIGNASSSSSQSKNNQNAAASNAAGGSRSLTPGAAATAQRPRTKTSSGALNTSKVGELNKDNCKVLADKRINGVVVYARTQDMSTLKRIIDDMDIKLSQVLIETVIIEVSLGDDLNTGIDWVQRGRSRERSQEQVVNQLGQPMYYMQRTTTSSDGDTKLTSTEILPDMVPANYSREYHPNADDTTTTIADIASSVPVLRNVSTLVHDSSFFNQGGSMIGGGGGNGTAALQSLFATVATNAAEAALGANPIGSGINYYLKSDKLNIAAVIQASKTDTRAKYIASPVVMTVDNKEATIEATESRKFYSGSTSSGSYGYNNTSYNYSDKDIGIKIKITPKINPDGTVMLTVEEEYSQLGGGQTVFVSSDGGGAKQEPIDTAVNRKMSADILLDNMQTVILGGLTETYHNEKESGIPILKDIPWIGKWLFGSVSQSEQRKELLVFMTPYVLDDAHSAQAEAFRRKKSLSDPRPWEDHGWSASELADPVSKKEMLRRFKDEWARQDEERKTKLAIEKAKIDRAKALEQMDEKERKFWLELHKDELEKEKKEEFEKQMEEQKDLKELAESIRSKKLEKAEEKLKAEDAATKGETERERLNKEKEAAAHPEPAPSPTQSESSPGRAGSPLPAAKTIFDGGRAIPAMHINGYLMDAPDVWIEKRSKPICDVPEIFLGGQPIDDGNLILTEEEKDDLLARHPSVVPLLRPFMMGKDFINRKPRWCLWMKDADISLVRSCSDVMDRIRKVREFRLASKRESTLRAATTPAIFGAPVELTGHYIALPKVSSENRRYIPIDYLPPKIIPGDKLFVMPDATLYHFGILTSIVHMLWNSVVGGRLKSDYSYSNTIVYNNFPWPDLCDSASLRETITSTARAILDARVKYPNATLADLYDPDTMYLAPDLRAAHEANDRAVLAAYGLAPDTPEPEIVAHLFKLYAEMMKKGVTS